MVGDGAIEYAPPMAESGDRISSSTVAKLAVGRFIRTTREQFIESSGQQNDGNEGGG